MKNKITLYLFVFTALVLFFQLVNSKKILDDQAKRLVKLEADNKSYEATVSNLQDQLDQVSDFSLEKNNYALEFFKNMNIYNISNLIKDQLYDKNLLIGKNNLIPYEAVDRTFLINKIKVLNHKWLIANFSDGSAWGELLIAYKIHHSGNIDFELKEHFLYPTPD